MATFTTNCKLHQWEPGDHFLRTDFNEDFAKIDAALGARPTQTSLDSQLAAVNQSVSTVAGRVEVRIGSYVGNGADSRTINVGFKPKAVFTQGASVLTGSNIITGALALENSPAKSNGTAILTVTASGFTVYSPSTSYRHMNDKSKIYFYLAFK